MLDFPPVLVADGTKISPPGHIFDQPPCERSLIQTKLADHIIGDRVVLSPGTDALVTSPGTESSNPPPTIVERFLIVSHVETTGGQTKSAGQAVCTRSHNPA